MSTLVLGCPQQPRDTTEASHDVVGSGGTDAGVAPDGYVYVARRPHGTIALAEARGMTDEEGRALTDRVADDFESCARRLESSGQLISGAARVVAVADKGGNVAGLNVKVSSGSEQNTLVCLVAPLRATNFPGRPDAPQRGVAIEAAWSRTPGNMAVDGGGSAEYH